MKTEQGVIVIKNGQLIDGSGNEPTPDAALVIEDGLISYSGTIAEAPELTGEVRTIDASGGTILPGLVEAHYHATYFDVAELEDLDIKYPVEFVTILASCNARLALECGYTSARSGGRAAPRFVRP